MNTIKNLNNNIRKKKFTKKNFNSRFNLGFKSKYLNSKNKIILMYDPTVPYGKNNKNSKKIFVHYLKIGEITYLDYYPPTPPKGEHIYVIRKINLCQDKINKIEKILLDLEDNRTHPVFQNFSERVIFGLKIKKNTRNYLEFYVEKKA
jgi:hypothetical protein